MILSLMGLRMIHRVLSERHSFFLVHASSAFFVVYEVPMLQLKLCFVVRDSSEVGKFCDDHEQKLMECLALV